MYIGRPWKSVSPLAQLPSQVAFENAPGVYTVEGSDILEISWQKYGSSRVPERNKKTEKQDAIDKSKDSCFD